MNRNNGRQIGERLILLRDYLISNADKTHTVSMKDIQSHYANHEITGKEEKPLNHKTIYRDLDAVGEVFGLNIQYDEHKKGYSLLNAPFEAYELRLIIDSIQASRFITQQEARKLTEKVKATFGSRKQKDLNRQAYVYDRIRSMNDSVVKEADRIHQAIASDCKIAFHYFHLTPSKQKSYSNDGTQYRVSPFALYWNSGNLYLYAYDGAKFRYFRVDRMERITRPIPEPREGKDLFNAKSLTSQKAKVFQMYSGPGYDVKLRFANELTDQVIDQFGRETMLFPDGSSHFTFTVPVEVSPNFYAWVATFGSHSQIIGPPEVVEGMRNFLKEHLNMYKDDGNT